MTQMSGQAPLSLGTMAAPLSRGNAAMTYSTKPQSKSAPTATSKTPAAPSPGLTPTALSAAQALPSVVTTLKRYAVWGPNTATPLTSLAGMLKRCKDPQELARLYQAQVGRPLLADVTRAMKGGPVALRDSVTRLYAPSQMATLSFDAFVEQLAISAAYSNEADLSDAKQAKSTSSTGKFLAEMGYRAGQTIHGRWGFQMRVFTPDKTGKVKPKFTQTVVAFRGTESVSPPWATPNRAQADTKAVESVRDTVVGDMNALGPGYGQYRPNRDLVRVQLKHAVQKGRVVSTGHSLGGALAQIVGADNPEFVDTVVSFAAPGIDKDDVKRLREWNGRHEGQEVTARHYRASGDIVPGSGEARLDGQIFTFDRYVTTRERGAEVFRTANGGVGQAAHNAFVLRDFLARVPAKDLDEVGQAVVQYGGVDSQAFKDGTFDPAHVTTMVLAGLHQASQDPTIQTELARKYATPYIYSVSTVHRLLQDLPYEVLLARTDKQLANISAEQVRKAGGLTKALAGLRKKILATESVILTMEDVKFFGMLDRDDLVTLGAFDAAFNIPKPVKLNDRQIIAQTLTTRWRSWHPGAEDLK